MIERKIRHLQRYREIAFAFSRNGFGFIVKELGLYNIISLPKRLFIKDKDNEFKTKTTGERIRLFLEELGPTFVKLGQIASTRPDLIPSSIIEELEKLHDKVPPFAYEDVKGIIEAEFEGNLTDIFDDFDEKPLGAASIGQVHYAVLKTGEPVAVKVQRPMIEKIIQTDLEILYEIASLAEKRFAWAARYEVCRIVEEFSKALRKELDYTNEGRNADRIAGQFKDDTHIYIPSVYWDYTTKKVLTMEYVEGTKLNNISELTREGYDTKILAERVANSVFHQILIEGFFHGDPHPGNVAAFPGNGIVYMDFGMVGRLTPDMKANFANLVIAIMRQRTDGVIRGIMRMGLVSEEVNIQQLTVDVDDLKAKYYDVPLSKVRLGEAVNDLFAVAQEHQIRIPADLTLLGKTLLTMEGLVETLDPDLSIIKIAEPFGKQLLIDRLHPKNVAASTFSYIGDYGDSLLELPKQINELTKVVKKGKLPLEVNIPNVERFLTKLDRISNRLSFSIVLLSFSIIMVGLIIGSAMSGQSSVLWNLPAIEIGFTVALLMFLWLLYSIFKSGRF
ncbi:AarF/ABC1/UbiB kinase family protein [Salipaludibacillus sp. LMS25]|jgi:ubiquinone biosynthesis protein|uniref:ABC1 kinase family protein n=1 Tax=Salipaludibacillus sp. LMS25 TaxID=2924031 RepID=UPI0020D00461|nr:AarF/ABC1/UbiB kinase family protein [Salipaludibacillus sp. LMS25]UTR14111.1 AarF/ABC1/UbiB kinase family protein [Salipaludibacillus sp. LMS25]